MKRSWIKLYLEIINDPKMGKLPDYLWRRAIELFLLAGENGDDGLLQPVTDLAWRLRPCTEQQVEKSLVALSEVGVVHETPQGWVVTHFAKRQEALTGTERSRLSRSRNDATKRCKTCNDNATDDVADSLSSSPSESVSDSERGGVGEETKDAPALHLFTDCLGKFHGKGELDRWLVIVDACGMKQAGELIAWADKKEIHLTNRPGLLDSLETAAKNWRAKQQPKQGKTFAEQLEAA